MNSEFNCSVYFGFELEEVIVELATLADWVHCFKDYRANCHHYLLGLVLLKCGEWLMADHYSHLRDCYLYHWPKPFQLQLYLEVLFVFAHVLSKYFADEFKAVSTFDASFLAF